MSDSETNASKNELQKTFSEIENHDLKVSTVFIYGREEVQERTLKDLKNFHFGDALIETDKNKE